MCVSSKSPSFGLACEIRLHLNALRLYTHFSYDIAIFGVNSPPDAAIEVCLERIDQCLLHG